MMYSFFFLCAFVSVDATIKNYKIIAEDPNYYHVAKLVSPRNLLENFASIDLLLKDEAESNNTCFLQLAEVSAAIANQNLWALKMLDASSKIPAGILQGNFIDLGMYDECMAIRDETLEIRGRQCMYTANVAQQENVLPFMFSICIPASCSPENVKKIVTDAIERIPYELNVTISSAECAAVDEKTWDTEFIVCFSILMLYISFLTACTVCEIVCDQSHLHENKMLNTLTQFSFKKNAAAIFNLEINKGSLPALHGIRCTSMAWVVLSHEYSIFATGATVNIWDIFEWATSWKSLYIFLGYFAVDTFFAVSGFLMTYIFLKKMPKQKTFNIPMYYLHRFLRLTPVVIAIIVFTTVFVPKIESGGLLYVHSRNTTLEGCREKWWSILLYVQNFVHDDNSCLGHLWYLAVDMQLFWLSPIVLYPLYKKPKFGLIITTLLLLMSLVISTLLITLNNYHPLSFVLYNDPDEKKKAFRAVYVKTYCRAAAWLVGILMGYELSRKTQKPKKHFLQIGWLMALAGFAFCIFGTRYFTTEDYEYNAVLEALFTSLSRPIWGFGICWIVYASFYNYSGPLATILSSRIFLPFSRLSYCIYIVHFIVQFMQFGGARTSKYFSDYYVWYHFLGDFIISVAGATCFSLLFESPIIVLEKIIFRQKKEGSKSDSEADLKSNTTSEESINK